MSDKTIHPLTAFRERHGLSMTELAKLCVTTQQRIDYIEKNWGMPRKNLAHRIFEVTSGYDDSITPTMLAGLPVETEAMSVSATR